MPPTPVPACFNILFSISPLRAATLLSGLLSRQTFHWEEVNYVSEFLFPLWACCLTGATKLNTRSGCPQRNLASNSKDFPESFAKLLGIIFLYFGAPVTCCRYLFSLLLFFFFYFAALYDFISFLASQWTNDPWVLYLDDDSCIFRT